MRRHLILAFFSLHEWQFFVFHHLQPISDHWMFIILNEFPLASCFSDSNFPWPEPHGDPSGKAVQTHNGKARLCQCLCGIYFISCLFIYWSKWNFLLQFKVLLHRSPTLLFMFNLSQASASTIGPIDTKICMVNLH